MNSVSEAFVVLFAVVFLARLTIGRRKNEPLYLGLLIAAGVVFYAWHVPKYILILLASTTVDYFAARALGRMPRDWQRRRRLILAASLTTNLGLLAFFKYANFVIRVASDSAHLFGIPVDLGGLSVVLPIGISFYTFEAMSYTIDVYLGQIEPVRSFPQFFLFISFFPHLVAGPIVRAWEFIPQIRRPRRLRAVALYEGVWLITSGYFLKTVCADNLAVFVNQNWHRGYDPTTNSLTAVWLGLLFSAQIFADFAGYSNIARGLAYLLGFRLPINFNAPYIATSFRNFWERWHITLSRWLRDYLYIPLGGNRLSRRRTYANLLIVMLIGGLWHGAAYTFIVWGALHGASLAIERALGLHREPVSSRALVVRLVWPVVVQIVVLAAWVFFRSETLPAAIQFIGNIARLRVGPLPAWALSSAVFILPIVWLHAWSWIEERFEIGWSLAPVRAAMTAAMLFAILALHGQGGAFIYFQF